MAQSRPPTAEIELMRSQWAILHPVVPEVGEWLLRRVLEFETGGPLGHTMRPVLSGFFSETFSWTRCDPSGTRFVRRRYQQLVEQVELVGDELRRRVGQTFTLRELAAAYRDGESWARAALEARAPGPGWPRDLALVLAAAFHAYQRGAVDYAA